MSNVRPIDWRSIDDINKDLDHLETTKADPDSPFGTDGPMKVEMGQVLTLKVRVLDPELAQVVLGRSFVSDEGSRIPGMAIDEIGIRPEQQQKMDFVKHLRALADDLEHEAQTETGEESHEQFIEWSNGHE
jgi:hypothetical protein